MPFSQQSYQGQGITQQNVTPIGGQLIGQGLAAFGQGIGAGIEKAGANKSEAKKLRAAFAPFAEELAPAYGTDPKSWKAFLDDKGLGELKGIETNLFMQRAMQELEQQKLRTGGIKRQDNQAKADDAYRQLITNGIDPKTAAQQITRKYGAAPSTGPQDIQAAVDRNVVASEAGGAALEAAKSGQAPSIEAMSTAASMSNQKDLSAYRKVMAAQQQAQFEMAMLDRMQEQQDRNAMMGLSDEQFKTANDMFSKLQADPAVRRFIEAQSMYSGLESIVASGGNPSGPKDIALIFSFMKAMDPGSTVREGEFATASNSGGIPDTITNVYNKALNGELLNQEQRVKFLEAAQASAASMAEAANQVRGRYVKQGSNFSIPEQAFAGDKFALSRKVFNSDKDVQAALDAGTMNEGDVFFIPVNGRLKQFRAVNQPD